MTKNIYKYFKVLTYSINYFMYLYLLTSYLQNYNFGCVVGNSASKINNINVLQRCMILNCIKDTQLWVLIVG